MYLFLLILYFSYSETFNINTRPHINYFNNNLPLFWKIAKKNQISNKPSRFLFNDFPICIYKDNNNKIIAISDICVHRAACLSQGKLLENNCIQCPYHGWEYNKGIVDSIPGVPDIKKKAFGVPQFEIKELNEDIFIRPTFDINSKKGNIYNHTIFIPPEANNDDFVRISGFRLIKRPNNIITENVLDMMHISYVHSFGNSLSPVPFKINYEDINELSGKTTFYYTSGPSSMSKIIGGAQYVKVENEFHLPDYTVTRVIANNLVKTIVTNCYPIGKNESILHYDLYRNFLNNPIFDSLFKYQMKITLDEDIKIINKIYDNHLLGFISNKYDITQIKYRDKKRKVKKLFEK